MSDKLHLLRLTTSDVIQMRALNSLFARAFEDEETYSAQPPSDAYLTELLNKEHVIALVALKEDVVVGGPVAYELDKFEQARR